MKKLGAQATRRDAGAKQGGGKNTESFPKVLEPSEKAKARGEPGDSTTGQVVASTTEEERGGPDSGAVQRQLAGAARAVSGVGGRNTQRGLLHSLHCFDHSLYYYHTRR